MKHSLFIKGITLTCFIALIGTFLIYRSGRFNSFFSADETLIQSSHNGGIITTSGAVIFDSTKTARLSSSKSMVITDNKLFTAPTRSSLRDVSPRMSSSKSLVITDNDPLLIDKRKRDYLYYAISLRSELFQDSLRRSANALPAWLQFKLDSIRLNSKN